MGVVEVANDMRTRVPWDVAKRIFLSLGAPKSQGWDKTVEKLEDASGQVEEFNDGLIAALQQHYMCGEKLTRFYKLKQRDIRTLREYLEQAHPTESVFQRSYPALLPEKDVEKQYLRPPSLTHVAKTEDGIAAIFASVRAVSVRETIDDAELPKELASAYDEVVGLKLIKFQAMDVIWVPHDGDYVDVRVDFPKGMTHDQGVAAHEATKKALRDLIETELLLSSVNLFPLINLIYRQRTEGSVVELAFGTTTASLKHEKMRRRHTCLRQEVYHKGGKAALSTAIEPYRLSVEYSVDYGAVTSFPELSLNGSARMIGSTNPVVSDVVIRKCLGLSDYEHVRSRIEHFIALHNASSS